MSSRFCSATSNAEVHHLAVLLEEIFPEYLRYMITIVISAQGNAKVNFSRVDEYAIFCVPDTGTDVIEGSPIDFLPVPEDLEGGSQVTVGRYAC